MNPAAEAHYRQGLALYAQRDFAGALRELHLGHAIDPRPEFLFAEAQAHRLAGDCARALPLYDAFLAASPTPVQIEATRLARARCTDAVATRTPDPAPAPRPAWLDAWGLGTLGAGVAVLGVGVGFAVAGQRAQDDANAAAISGTYPDFATLQDRAGTRHDVATIAFVAGGALATVGLVRLVYVIRRGTEPETTQAPGARPTSSRPTARAVNGAGPDARGARSLASGLAPALVWTGTPDGQPIPLFGLVGRL